VFIYSSCALTEEHPKTQSDTQKLQVHVQMTVNGVSAGVPFASGAPMEVPNFQQSQSQRSPPLSQSNSTSSPFEHASAAAAAAASAAMPGLPPNLVRLLCACLE
jgi:hypothetical protein